MDRSKDPAFFTDEEVGNFVEQLSERGIRMYIGSPSSSSKSTLHPILKQLVSEELDLKNSASASVLPMASDLAKLREEKSNREWKKCQVVSLPYVHDDESNKYQQIGSPNNDSGKEETFEACDKISVDVESSGRSEDYVDECNDDPGKSKCKWGTEKEVKTDASSNESNYFEGLGSENDEIDSGNTKERNCQTVQLKFSQARRKRSSFKDINLGTVAHREEDHDEINSIESNESDHLTRTQQVSQQRKKRSLHRDINSGIVAQREKIRNLCNNRQKDSKFINEARQKRGGESPIEEEQNQDTEHHTEGSASEGCFETEDEQSDDLIEFESEKKQPIARKRNSNSLLATSEAIGSYIAKTDDHSEWNDRTSKRRNKLKKPKKQGSIDNKYSTNKSSTNARNSTPQRSGRRRTIGFGAAPRAVNMRKTQLSLLHLIKK